MSTSYPELKKSEKLRMSLTALTSLLPVFFALAGLLIFEGSMGALIGFAVGCFSAYVAIKTIYSRVKIICPVCGSQSIRENEKDRTSKT